MQISVTKEEAEVLAKVLQKVQSAFDHWSNRKLSELPGLPSAEECKKLGTSQEELRAAVARYEERRKER